MMTKLEIVTAKRNELVDITAQIQQLAKNGKHSSGLCLVYVSHTTAGITINENADPAVREDILNFLEKLAPRKAAYHHAEGNADAHIETSLTGSSATLMIENGELLLGIWQGIFLCEFDGPRKREVWIKILAG